MTFDSLISPDEEKGSMSRWERLRETHTGFGGGKGIYGKAAKTHDKKTGDAARYVFGLLEKTFPELVFRHRFTIPKTDINEKLSHLNPELGVTQFVMTSSVKPDGGVIEVRDVQGGWRAILIAEAKKQGTNVKRIEEGLGKQAQGNAIERTHKNIAELKNYMIGERYFPYVVFMHGSDLTTKTLHVPTPSGKIFDLHPTSIPDRLTAASYGMPVNVPYCRNIFAEHIDGSKIMLQIASLYMRNEPWREEEMIEVMIEIAEDSLTCLGESEQL